MRQKRSGHCSFLILIFFACIVVHFVFMLIGTIAWGPPKLFPFWYKILSIALNPAGLLLVLFMAAWVFSLAWMGSMLMENQAERIGLAVWQYEKEKMFGIPLGFLKRAMVVITAYYAGACSMIGIYGGVEKFLEAGIIAWYYTTLMSILFATGIVLTAAQLSIVPAKKL